MENRFDCPYCKTKKVTYIDEAYEKDDWFIENKDKTRVNGVRYLFQK